MSAAITIAGCGSSSTPPNPSASRDQLAYVKCLRAHGVPSFPDPGPGAPLRIPSDIDTQAPAFRSAENACADLMPGGANGAGSSSDSQQLLAIAKCMRAHGVARFPDPTTSPPPPSSGNAIGGHGVYLSIGPPPNRQSPAFKTAAAACRLP